MEQQEFLEKNVFVDLKNVNENFEADNIHQFSEAEFATVLQKCEYFGIGIYTIEAFLSGASFGVSSHDTHNKKATDPKYKLTTSMIDDVHIDDQGNIWIGGNYGINIIILYILHNTYY